MVNGYLRTIQKLSDSVGQYLYAHERVLRACIGAVMLEVDEDDGTIRMRRVKDATTVFFDPAAEEDDFSDAECCTVDVEISKKKFERTYPDASLPDHDKARDTVTIHETFRKVYSRVIPAQLDEDGKIVIEELEVPLDKPIVECVCWTDAEILGIDRSWKGHEIPVALEIGPWDNLESEEGFRMVVDCLTRRLEPSQQAINFHKSEKKALISSWPRFRWMGEEGFMMRPGDWASDKLAVEYARGKKPEPVPPPPLDSASTQEVQEELQMARMVTGINPQSKEDDNKIIPTSGVSIQQQQAIKNVAVYHWNACLQRMIKRVTWIAIDAIVEMHNDNSPRMATMADGTSVPVSFGPDTDEGMPGFQQGMANIDLRKLKLNVDVTIGASYSSQRAEAMDRLDSLLKKMPQLFPYVAPAYLKFLAIPGIEEVGDVIQAAMLPPNVQQLMQSLQGDTPERKISQLMSILKIKSDQADQFKTLLEKTADELQTISSEYTNLKRDRGMQTEADLEKTRMNNESSERRSLIAAGTTLAREDVIHHNRMIEGAMEDVKQMASTPVPGFSAWGSQQPQYPLPQGGQQ